MLPLVIASFVFSWSGDDNAIARMSHPWPSKPVAERVKHNGTDIDYMVGSDIFQGYVSLPAMVSGDAKFPGILVAHQWMGLGDYEKSRADQFAAQGYVVFALDVYGKGIRCTTPSCAKAAMDNATANLPRLLELISAGTGQLIKAGADSSALVAIGYCFGGSMVLELARHPNQGAASGAQYTAVSSVHGVLAPLSTSAATGEITTRVQVHHGELDYQGDAALTQLKAELTAGVNGTRGLWEVTEYAKCQHGWTEPGTAPYDARGALQAHQSTYAFFEMALGRVDPTDPYQPLSRCPRDGRPPRQPALPGQPALTRQPAAQPLQTDEYFTFSATYLNSTRQWGKCLHVIIKYRYPAGGYWDYKPMRQEAIDLLLTPTADLPVK